ncbi:MAG: type II secretion system protein [Gammaproteobacteria bacterium]|nr:type II secretion system protein [Gammaproteobacteria bacterium]
MNAKRKQSGFTIIELVVVILLLGILTATALPRFMDVTNQAHTAVVDAVEGGFTTGVALFRAQWVGEGQPLTTVTNAAGFNLYASTAGYPRSATILPSAVATVTTANTCVDVYNSILQSGGRPSLGSIEGLGADAAATRETALEAAALATIDIVTVLQKDNATPTVATVSCIYYYVGQFKSGTVAAPVTIPTITYNYLTGAIARGTLVLNLG